MQSLNMHAICTSKFIEKQVHFLVFRKLNSRREKDLIQYILSKSEEINFANIHVFLFACLFLFFYFFYLFIYLFFVSTFIGIFTACYY